MSSTQTVPSAKRRVQAIGGGLAGLALVVVLAVVFFVVRATGDDEPGNEAAPAPAATSAAAAPEPQPTQPDPAQPDPAQPAQPGPVETPPALSKEPTVTGGKGTLTKLGVTQLVKGTGATVAPGQTITVNYVLVAYKGGKLIEKSWGSQPATFPIGVGQVIPGWDQGIPGQKVGSRVQLDVPAELAYGKNATGGRPAGDLRFVVDILAAQ